MNCPVCKTGLNFASPPSEGFLLDCPSCQSSLEFQDGEMKILKQSEQSALQEESSQNFKENSSDKENLNHSSRKQQADRSRENFQGIDDSFLEQPSFSEKLEGDLAGQDDAEEKVSAEQDALNKKEELRVNVEEDAEEEGAEANAGQNAEAEAFNEDFEDEDMPQVPSINFKPDPNIASAEKESAHFEDQESSASSEENKASFEEEEPKNPEDLSDLSRSANVKRTGSEGLFFYDLKISEINSKDLREQIELVLEDEDLKLNTENGRDIKIKEGALHLKKISPVKVHIIVKSLIGLPLKISWNQHLVADSS